MNPDHVLIACLHLGFTLVAMAASCAWSARVRHPLARWMILACGFVPLFLFNGALLSKAAELRFHAGVGNSPWVPAALVLGVQGVAGLVLVLRARGGGGAMHWSAPVLTFATAMMLTLDVCAFRCLDLQAQLLAADLRFDSGMIAYQEVPRSAPDAANAALVYSSLQVRLEEDEDAFEEWSDALEDKVALDHQDPALRNALRKFESALGDVRAAARLEACEFPTGQEVGADLVGVPRVGAMLQISRALALESRVRAADGDFDGALADLSAGLLFSRQIARIPSLASLMCGTIQRATVVHTLAHVLSQRGLRAEHLERIDPRAAAVLREPFTPLMSRALALEEAFGLSVVGKMGLGMAPFTQVDRAPGLGLDDALYRVFLLESDVRAYRECLHEQQLLARGTLADALRAEADNAGFAQKARRGGILSSMLVPNATVRLIMLYRNDAESRLGALALELARLQIESGGYPTTAAELPFLEPDVRIEGDGTFVRISNTTDGFEDRPVLRLPPARPAGDDGAPR